MILPHTWSCLTTRQVFKNTMKRILLIVLIPLLFLTALSAYDYAELRDHMLRSNADYLALQEEYFRSQLDAQDAKASFGPTVDMLVTGTYMIKPPIGSVTLNVNDIISSIQWPGAAPEVSQPYVNVYDGMEDTLYTMLFTITQPLYTWGKLTNALKLYNQISDIRLTQLMSKEKELETELETRLLTLELLKRINTILTEEKGYADRLVQVSEDAERSGVLLHQDVVEARIQAKELEIAKQDVEEQIATQLLEVRLSTGIDDLTVDQIEYEIDEAKLEAIMAQDRGWVQAHALNANQLSIKLLIQLREMNQTAEEIARDSVNWKPDIGLEISVGYGGYRVPLIESNWLRKDDYTLNLTLAIKTTIWDGGKKLRDISRRESESRSQVITEDEARATIIKTLNEQWNTVDVCTMKIEYQDLKLEACDSKIAQTETIWKTGYGSETDVLSAKIDRCNQQLEKEKQTLMRAAACMTIDYLSN